MTAIRGTPAQGPRPACPRLSAPTTAPTPYLRHAHPLPTPCSHPVHSLPTPCPHSTHTAHTLSTPFPCPSHTQLPPCRSRLVSTTLPTPRPRPTLILPACSHLSPVAHILKHVVAHTPTRPQPRPSSALPHGPRRSGHIATALWEDRPAPRCLGLPQPRAARAGPVAARWKVPENSFKSQGHGRPCTVLYS